MKAVNDCIRGFFAGTEEHRRVANVVTGRKTTAENFLAKSEEEGMRKGEERREIERDKAGTTFEYDERRGEEKLIEADRGYDSTMTTELERSRA